MAHLDFSHIKTATVHGKRYKVRWRRPKPCPTKGEKPGQFDGKCDAPTTLLKEIYIHKSKDPFVLVETVAHELLHSGLGWSLAEEFVDKYAEDLVRMLRRMGAKITFEPNVGS